MKGTAKMMIRDYAFISICLVAILSVEGNRRSYSDSFENLTKSEGKSENNGVFVQIPHSSPPTIRPPPYTISHSKCAPQNVMENWMDTLCGDLNSGLVPQNPMGHKFLDGGTYPFEPIKNKTLVFFRHALPVLKSDSALPKVAKYVHEENLLREESRSYSRSHRVKRGLATRAPSDPNPAFFDASYPDIYDYDQLSLSVSSTVSPRQRRTSSRNGFCENRGLGYYNRLCKLYNAMWGKSPHNVDRDSSGEVRRHPNHMHGSGHQTHRSHHHHSHSQQRDHIHDHHHSHGGRKHQRQAFHSRPDLAVEESDWTSKASKYPQTARIGSNRSPQNSNDRDLPPTPCPSTAEYLTPVFARNHEGAWRYVVQIPKEGYFTQTVEVTKCLTSTCYYMEGSCKTSPRWQSLLVAELYYPESTFPTTPKTTPAPVQRTTKKSPISILTGAAEEYPDYLYSKGGSASLENLSGNAYSNELMGLLPKRIKRSAKDFPEKKDPAVCDGYDDVGCYQLRLFYDWFLIPGACKCWRRQFDFTFASNSG